MAKFSSWNVERAAPIVKLLKNLEIIAGNPHPHLRANIINEMYELPEEISKAALIQWIAHCKAELDKLGVAA